MLQERGATVRACDPQGRRQAEPLLPGVIWCDSAEEAAQGADILVVITEWNEYRALDLEAIKARMAGTTIVDLRNALEPEAALELGFDYSGVGRGRLLRLKKR
jgi:UDPglucose 6-dehydrogenase